jgi:exodeoxyribonuclease VII large subunit
VLLLVRGGGSLEDLWAFNDESVVRAVAASSLPVVVGVGHETDFTLADFAADLRAPTPTAAAELCAAPQAQRLGELAYLQERLSSAVQDAIDERAQRLDLLAQRLGRPSARLSGAREHLRSLQSGLQGGLRLWLQRQSLAQRALAQRLPQGAARALDRQRDRLERSRSALSLLDPDLVLKRGYAYLTDPSGHAITSAAQVRPGDDLLAALSDGQVPLRVRDPS